MMILLMALFTLCCIFYRRETRGKDRGRFFKLCPGFDSNRKRGNSNRGRIMMAGGRHSRCIPIFWSGQPSIQWVNNELCPPNQKCVILRASRGLKMAILLSKITLWSQTISLPVSKGAIIQAKVFVHVLSMRWIQGHKTCPLYRLSKGPQVPWHFENNNNSPKLMIIKEPCFETMLMIVRRGDDFDSRQWQV